VFTEYYGKGVADTVAWSGNRRLLLEAGPDINAPLFHSESSPGTGTGRIATGWLFAGVQGLF
jgi:hypothetical protein